MGIGAGFRAGPVSVGVGTSWRGLGRDGATVFGAILVLMLIMVPVALGVAVALWPYALGAALFQGWSKWVEIAVGLTFEAVYLFLLLSIAGIVLQRKQERLL